MSARYGTPNGDVRNLRVIVHPDRRRRGIGTRLVELAESQDDDGVACRSACLASWTIGAAMLAARGFEPSREDLTMVRDVPPPPSADAAGVAIDATPDDDAWKALHADGYGGVPTFTPLTAGDLERYRAEDGFRLWFARERDEAVGMCHANEFGGGETWINSIVVARPHRGRGIGRALLAHALRALADDGEPRVHLVVRAANEPAVALYRSLGFETIQTETVWRRAATAGR